jgi:energy-coupling factor transport system ATP-binding protein
MIRVKDLRVVYPDQPRAALTGMDLSMEAGERVLISGPTGCGKSTLGLALCGAIPGLIPGRLTGAVHLDGRSVLHRPMRETARVLGFLLQHVAHQVFTDRVDDEIAFGLENFNRPPDRMAECIRTALNRVEASHLADRSLNTLSAGERQRVMLAALLALDQPVLVLDEPLAYLDAAAQRRFPDLTARLSRAGKTLLVFEHRRDLLRPGVDREIAMSGGRTASPAAASAEMRFPEVPPARTGEIVLTAEGVNFAWSRRAAPLLKALSFAVRKGESVVLLGENGAGKTTLFSLVTGLRKSTSGVIHTCGHPVHRTRPERLACRAGFLFQHPDHQLYLARVKDEVFMQAGDSAAAARELAELDLEGLTERHPRSLSMGQKRRLTIAAALARQPQLLLLDEPSVGQDDRNLARIIHRLSRFLQEGGALLTATHDARFARAMAHRVLILKNGCLREDSTEAVSRFFSEDGCLPSESLFPDSPERAFEGQEGRPPVHECTPPERYNFEREEK